MKEKTVIIIAVVVGVVVVGYLIYSFVTSILKTVIKIFNDIVSAPFKFINYLATSTTGVLGSIMQVPASMINAVSSTFGNLTGALGQTLPSASGIGSAVGNTASLTQQYVENITQTSQSIVVQAQETWESIWDNLW